MQITENNASFEVLTGAIDLQVHVGPDVVPRLVDAIELVNYARAAGMGGVLIKDHVTLTSDRAYLLNRIFPDFKVFGAIALNHPVGGLNVQAVRAAIRHGVKQVYMPTFSAANDIRLNGRRTDAFAAFIARDEQDGISILDAEGNIRPALIEILSTIAEADVALGTGHLSPTEILRLIPEALKAGVKKIIVTHPLSHSVNMSISEQERAISAGAVIEYSYLNCMPGISNEPSINLQIMADMIKKNGARHFVLSSDLGRCDAIHPVEGFKALLLDILKCGISREEIDMMVRTNPRRLMSFHC